PSTSGAVHAQPPPPPRPAPASAPRVHDPSARHEYASPVRGVYRDAGIDAVRTRSSGDSRASDERVTRRICAVVIASGSVTVRDFTGSPVTRDRVDWTGPTRSSPRPAPSPNTQFADAVSSHPHDASTSDAGGASGADTSRVMSGRFNERTGCPTSRRRVTRSGIHPDWTSPARIIHSNGPPSASCKSLIADQ